MSIFCFCFEAGVKYYGLEEFDVTPSSRLRDHVVVIRVFPSVETRRVAPTSGKARYPARNGGNHFSTVYRQQKVIEAKPYDSSDDCKRKSQRSSLAVWPETITHDADARRDEACLRLALSCTLLADRAPTEEDGRR